MKKFRTYKKHSLVYSLEREGLSFRLTIEKNGAEGVENSSYLVNGQEKELKALLCRLWSCGVTPMSLVYILEDEGYIPQSVENDDELVVKAPCLSRRKKAFVGETLKNVIHGKGKEAEELCDKQTAGVN